MIDTIIISIQKNYVSNVHNPMSPALGWDQQSKTHAYTKFVKNPSKKDLESGLYFPRLRGIQRKANHMLKDFIQIEFSIPKLLFKNNLDEVEEGDFDPIIKTLKERLIIMGVLIEEKYIRNASVSAVHYSKNILLTGGYTSQFIMNELGKIDIRKSFDFTKTRFMNDGQSIYVYTNAHSFVVYDKVADLKKDAKRAIDKDQTKFQGSLFDTLKTKELYEVIRFEIRLSRKQKLNSLFKKLGFADNPTFQEAFSKHISKAVVNHYWQSLVGENSLILFAPAMSSKDILRKLFISDPKIKLKQASYFSLLITALQDGGGARELRSIVGKYMNDREWYRVKTDIQKATELLGTVRPRDWFDQIENGLRDFGTFRGSAP